MFCGCEDETEAKNKPPVISSLTADPDSVEVNGTSDLVCVATDPDGDSLIYNWEIAAGSISVTGSNVTWTAPSSEGTYSVSCTVDDGNGGQDEKSINISTYEPDPNPEIISEFTSSDDSLISENIRERYRSDATYLAFIEMNKTSDSNTVIIDEGLIDSIYKGLIHIYNCTTITSVDTVTRICPIHAFPEQSMDRIVIGLDTTFRWTKRWLNGNTSTGNDTIDSLVTTFELDFYGVIVHTYALLTTDLKLNMHALAYHFRQVPGVLNAEPDALGSYGSGNNDIEVTFDQSNTYYSYSRGWDICVECCSDRWLWNYRVSDEGEVTFLGSY